jgi:glutathionyl-hydroquinone reductase
MSLDVVLIKQTIDLMNIVKRYKDVYESQYKTGMSRKVIYQHLREDFGQVAWKPEIGDTFLFKDAKKIIKQHMSITDKELS